jgi:hypothetical protein
MMDYGLVGSIAFAIPIAAFVGLAAYSKGWNDSRTASARAIPSIDKAIIALKSAMAIAGVRGRIIVPLEEDDLVALAVAIERELGSGRPGPGGCDMRLYKNPSDGVQFFGVSFIRIANGR